MGIVVGWKIDSFEKRVNEFPGTKIFLLSKESYFPIPKKNKKEKGRNSTVVTSCNGFEIK